MRKLLPLILSPSTTNTQPTLQSSLPSTVITMATRDSATDCNLPELLVRDLEDLDAVFASSLMTAGYPSLDIRASLASDNSDSHSIQGLDIPRHPTPYRPSASRTGPHSVVDKDTRTDMSGGDKPGFLAEFSDSSSDESADMEAPTGRTREQSFTTAATSVSGRCSSVLSKPISPSRASSQLDRARQGTWFDADVDEDTSTTSSPDPNSTEILGKPVAPCPLSALGFSTLNTREPVLSSLSPELRPTTATNRPIYAVTTDKRPHTASGHPRIGRPRLVEIQPLIAVPKRGSSLKKTRQHVGSFSAIAFGDACDPVEGAAIFRGPLNSNPIIPMLATSCGRTVIDASKPPSLDFSDQSQPARSVHNNNRTPFLNVADGFILDDRESEDEVSYAEASPGHSHGRKPSFATLDSWGSLRAASLTPLLAETATSTGSGVGIPLPPEVIETLRVSIACFPETMLLSSSLSIETIRSYSRKLKHRSTPSHRLSEDNQSVFSFSSCSAKSTSRWGLPRLLQGRPTKNYATSLITTPEQEVSAPQTPVTPYWTPIKNIFPNGSDYLCDALYAHIVAYNYINVLCPPLPVALPRTSVIGANEEFGVRIPRKAASLLGLQNDTPHLAPSAPASGYGNNQPSSPFRRSRSGFGLGLTSKPRRSGSTSEPAALRDVQIGLGRCISFLAATLKRLGEAPTEDETMVLQSDKEAVDPLLTRALCEAVRCSEEAISV